MRGCGGTNTSPSCTSRCDGRGTVFLHEQVGGQEGRIVTAVVPDAREQRPCGRIGDPVEFPAQGRCRRVGVMARRLDALVAEKALDVGDVHAQPQELRCHCVAQQVRIDPLGDAGLLGDLPDDLADALAAVGVRVCPGSL